MWYGLQVIRWGGNGQKATDKHFLPNEKVSGVNTTAALLLWSPRVLMLVPLVPLEHVMALI